MAAETVSLEPRPRIDAPAVSAAGEANPWDAGGPPAATPVPSDVDQGCEGLIAVLVGGIGVVSLALFAALGTFHS